MPFSSEPVVTVQDVSIYYDDNNILRHVNFSVQKGEFVYLIGRTGSGKTSLLRALYADQEDVKGELYIAGYQLSKIRKSKIPQLRRKIGIIFQDFQLLNDRSVAENLYFVMKATGWKDRSKMKARMADVLIRVGLASAASKLPHQLSGGEQQRIVIARALLNEPIILIADEPTGNLDPGVSDEIMKLFMDINRSGTSILMATHNHSLLDKYPNRVLKIENGELLDSDIHTVSTQM